MRVCLATSLSHIRYLPACCRKRRRLCLSHLILCLDPPLFIRRPDPVSDLKGRIAGSFRGSRQKAVIINPISEPVGYAVTLTYRGNRRYKPENILLTANDMPHGSDLSKISCRLQHPDRQCTLVLRRPCQSQQ